ncbi:hypothetical protein RHGRI_032164 [Rhododendron griersonianum]|uniref:Uncharacterized protein n=1 Tax=Rhododendron griersonianum TaxID=479676 RepID=A0AAV6IB92_9ERIC|nr:hypothetical protein RHGRI_032164 [Rhododendron griersonianum]
MASEASQTMSLKILVEKEKNRIVFVEANKDFVDVLFSFLTIPIATIFGLTREHSLEWEFGCLNNLYETLEKFDEDFLSSEHKGILLRPRCATDIYCRNLKVLKLLKCSLASRTPFSDSILEPPFSKTEPMINYGQYEPRMMNLSQRDVDTRNKDEKINLKLFINRSNNRVLYAEVEENFVNLLFSFLLVPIGYIIKECPYLSFMGCLGNLRKSVQDLDVNKFFKSEEMKAILLDPKLAPGTSYNNKLIGIEEVVNLSSSLLTIVVSISLSADTFILQTLRLLVASLVSRSALTDAFVRKETKQET